jgi:histidinol phosphatase-like enzyme (inositol monophosphatase family)
MLRRVTDGPAIDRALLDEVVALVREAGEQTLRWFRADDLVVERKGDGTPVTEADRAAERFLRDELARRFPGDAIQGEEEADTPGTTGRRWIIDPIDGTKAFTHGVPLFSNLLAYEDEHGPAIGVINLPALGETVYAARGVGCWCDDVPATVSTRDVLDGSYLTTSGFDHWHDSALLSVKAAGMTMRTWGDGYGYALVATGRVDAMVDPIVAPYDIAAMPVIMREAGGRFTDLGGVETIDGGSGIATNGRIHDELAALLSR